MTIRYISLLAVIFAISLSCTKENQPPTAGFSIDPLSGNDETIFMFDASSTTDEEDALEDLMIMWDWEGNGEFDTQYSSKKTADHIYPTPGEYMITLVVKDIRGLTDTLSKPLAVASSNLPPEIPENPYPANGATNLGVKINMKWECSDPDGDFILYNIYFGTSNPPPVYASNQAYLGLDLEKLDYGTTYYWKVNAKDVKGNMTEGSIWEFTTIDLHFGNLIDPRDGQSYSTIEIDSHWWLAENLKYATSEGSYRYDNDLANCARYGRLYTWEAAMVACPDGWHLPSKSEFESLLSYLGGADVAGGLLKDYETKYWREPNKGASNMSGFTALPAGRRYDQGLFAGLGFYAQFYSSTEFQDKEAYNLTLGYDYESGFIYNYKKVYAISVRCLKDY